MLEGKALQAVRGYRQIPSEIALSKVLDTLKTRFGNPLLVQEAHKEKLLNFKRLKDDADSLSEFLSDLTCYEVVNDYLNLSSVSSSSFLSALIDRLPYRLRDLFMDGLADRDLLNSKDRLFKSLMRFVEKRIRIHESTLGRKRTQVPSDNPDRSRKPPRKAFFFVNSVDSISDNAFSSARNFKSNATKNEHQNVKGLKRDSAFECLFCSKPGHLIYSCYIFISEVLANRIKFATEKNLCFSCLRHAHENSKCPIRSSPRLPNCKKNHHALLCSCSKEKALSREKDKEDSSGQKTVNFSVSHSTNTTNVRLHVLPLVISNNFGEEKKFMLCLIAEVSPP